MQGTKLWFIDGKVYRFKMFVEDTMRLIQGRPFKETIQEEMVTNVDDDVDDSTENDLALNVDHIFEADECDAFDSDVDEGPTSQTMFMASLTSEDPIYDEAGPSYDSNNPFEYVEDNEEHVVQCNTSSVRNDALMSILDEMHEQGMPSKHAMSSMWNMASNELEPGIPNSWVHECYWLSTWEEMYRFKINPCNRPDMSKK
ncbi:hypothetical protein Tco_0839646 [Tanacetum coccineum]|uniref:Uncharacterized protein n=1 Tax=Tanacetum coccineum TaxID=301880 RepID=A0ABQ5AW80_9ASTR